MVNTGFGTSFSMGDICFSSFSSSLKNANQVHRELPRYFCMYFTLWEKRRKKEKKPTQAAPSRPFLCSSRKVAFIWINHEFPLGKIIKGKNEDIYLIELKQVT